ncbi:hypothetical protein NQZ68_003872 [Dissostichus eleginoides]|nr:hypothetical protein NQZ68_003872 [Dissostichus eleginoides]
MRLVNPSQDFKHTTESFTCAFTQAFTPCRKPAAQCEGTVGMGQEGCAVEWSLQSQKQWGVSPDGLIPGRPLKEGLDQKKPS